MESGDTTNVLKADAANIVPSTMNQAVVDKVGNLDNSASPSLTINITKQKQKDSSVKNTDEAYRDTIIGIDIRDDIESGAQLENTHDSRQGDDGNEQLATKSSDSQTFAVKDVVGIDSDGAEKTAQSSSGHVWTDTNLERAIDNDAPENSFNGVASIESSAAAVTDSRNDGSSPEHMNNVSAAGASTKIDRLSSLLTITEEEDDDSFSGFYDDDEEDEFDFDSDDDVFEDIDLNDPLDQQHENDIHANESETNGGTSGSPSPRLRRSFKPSFLFPHYHTLAIREFDADDENETSQTARTEYEEDGGVTRIIVNIPRAAKSSQTTSRNEVDGVENVVSSIVLETASAEDGDVELATVTNELPRQDPEDPSSSVSICSSASSWRTGTNSYSSAGLNTVTSNSVNDSGRSSRGQRRNVQLNRQPEQEQQNGSDATSEAPEPPCPIKMRNYCRIVTALNVTSIVLCAMAAIARFGASAGYSEAINFLQGWLFVKEGEVAEDVIAYVTIGTVFYSLGVLGCRNHSAILIDAALLWYACSWVLNVAVWNIQGAILNAAFAFPHWTLEELFAQEEDVKVWEIRQRRKRIMEQLQQEHGLEGDELTRAADTISTMIEWNENEHSRVLLETFGSILFDVEPQGAEPPSEDGQDEPRRENSRFNSNTQETEDDLIRRRRCGCIRRRRRRQDTVASSQPQQEVHGNQARSAFPIAGSSSDPSHGV